MLDLCQDLNAECKELADFALLMEPADWERATRFHGWTPWDEVAHLCLLDDIGHLAATDEKAFAVKAAMLKGRRAAGEEISAIARTTYAHMAGPQLVAHWLEVNRQLAGALSNLDAKARLPWFGPTMSARSFATARLMETWAHGQDIFDLLSVRRKNSARLKHIAHLGVTTYEWTFKNRGLSAPLPIPYVCLQGPSGEAWSWGVSSSVDLVTGMAEDFCLVVTKRQHCLDTQLQMMGSAIAWLPLAQCFAGPPVDSPAPRGKLV